MNLIVTPDVIISTLAAVLTLLMVVTGLLLAWGIFRFRLLGLTPVARHTIIASADEAMFVLDGQDRVIDCNRAAQELAEVPADAIIGRPISRVLPVWPALAALAGQGDAPAEITVHKVAESRTCSVRLSPVTDAQGQPAGRILV